MISSRIVQPAQRLAVGLTLKVQFPSEERIFFPPSKQSAWSWGAPTLPSLFFLWIKITRVWKWLLISIEWQINIEWSLTTTSPVHLCGAVLKYRSWSKEISNIRIDQLSALCVPITQNHVSILPQLNSSDSVVGIATRLQKGQPSNHGLIQGEKLCLFSTASQLALGSTPPSILWVLETLLSRIKQLQNEVHLTATSIKFKIKCSYTSPYSSWYL